MGISNNDYNWRLVAAEDIEENRWVEIDNTGRVVKSDTKPCGIVPQAVKAGERAPVIRGGTISGLVGFSAGQQLRIQTDGSMGTGGSNPKVAVVKSEDATTAVILGANLDSAL